MRKYFLITSVLCLSFSTFAQKKELKAIDKAINRNELAQAQSLLSSISVNNVEEKYKPMYHFITGRLFFEQAKKTNNPKALLKASQAFTLSEQAGKDYISDIKKIKQEILNIARKTAEVSYTEKKIKESIPAFELVYRLNPTDTIYLYNAAQLCWQDKDFNKALKLFTELRDLKYDGSETIYSAKNKETGKFEDFADKTQRDLMVKSKTYTDPKDNKTPSKKADIIKLIGASYIELGQKEEAIKAFEEARKLLPKDASLLIYEAQLYWQLGDKTKFKELLSESLNIDPTNANAYFNIGVVSTELGDTKEALEAFNKALNLRPDYADAVMNISTIHINEGNKLVEVMNNLGTTKADLKKYDQMKGEKDNLFKKAAQVLEDYIQTQEPTKAILEQLKNIYAALGDTEKFKKYKQMIEK